MNSSLQSGDWVVLTGKGCNQPAPELIAIWTIEHLTLTHAIVSFNPDIQVVQLEHLANKRYPLAWLVLYRRGNPDVEDEDPSDRLGACN